MKRRPPGSRDNRGKIAAPAVGSSGAKNFVAGKRSPKSGQLHRKKFESYRFRISGQKGSESMAKADADSTKVTDIDSLTVSAAVLGRIFGVTDRRVRQMAKEGIIVRAAKGRYNLVESLKNYILSLKLAAEGVTMESPDGEIDIDEEKALHERVKRHISELKLQTMKGELHKAEDVERVMSDMLAAFKTRVMNIPSKVAPILEDRDTGYIKDRLTNEVVEVLNELKDYDPKAFYSDEYVEGEEDYEE